MTEASELTRLLQHHRLSTVPSGAEAAGSPWCCCKGARVCSGQARQAGLAEETIQAIARGTAPQGLAGDEAMLVRYVHELLRHHKISDATFNAVRDRFGMQKTLEITALIGHYLLVGQILAAFAVDLPEGATPEIPE
jgi:4-carboxymuconolactone decarboxylase